MTLSQIVLKLGMLACPLLVFCADASRCAAQQRSLDADAIRQSIERGVRYLKKQQNSNGSWSGVTTYQHGSTGLVTLALLNAGVSKDDAGIRKAIDYLGSVRDLKNYGVALRVMVYCAADPDRYRDAILRDVRWLEAAQCVEGINTGGWSYGESSGGDADASNSQFSLLALHEARLAGVEINQQVWERAKRYWLNCFDPDTGGFAYYPIVIRIEGPLGKPRGSMACAGISSMIIIEDNLADTMLGDNLEIRCCGGNMRSTTIDQAMQFMARDDVFRVSSNPIQASGQRLGYVGETSTMFYYLYGLERAARLAGVRFFGSHDWYREGAEHLVSIQNAAGFWRGEGNESSMNVATSLSLLFLSKGRRPIVIGKYQYGDSFDWDNHPKGVYYLTRDIERQWQQKLNWQTINGNVATVDDLLEAPVLFISGRDAIELNDFQKEQLRLYVENGGFIFAEACQGDGCGEKVAFDASFQQLMRELFPGSQAEPLEINHPVWKAWHQIKEPLATRPVLGIQASCRTSVIYIPANMSGVWQLNRPGLYERHTESARAEISYTMQLATNIVAYATNRDLKAKGERPKVAVDSDRLVGSRLLDIPKLAHGGGSDDAPNAWRNLLQVLRQEQQIQVKMDKTLVAARDEDLQKYPILFMHGRNRFQFDDAQRQAIREYLQRGGFLLVDSICSSRAFTEAFEAEIREILPNDSLQPIAAEDEIWSGDFNGYRIKEVEVRTPIANPGGEAFRRQKGPPQLKGVKLNGRYVVVFSPIDLSCALENASGGQCRSYSREDAARIAINVIMYGLLKTESE